MRNVYYAGIGSRETPPEILSLMTRIAEKLSSMGYILRSGGAPGADTAFEFGSDPEKMEIFLPWKGFEGNLSPLWGPSDAAMLLGAEFHPAWDGLSDGSKRMHARNCHQVLGSDLETPVSFVICWTQGGKATGGTGQALRIAESLRNTRFQSVQ